MSRIEIQVCFDDKNEGITAEDPLDLLIRDVARCVERWRKTPKTEITTESFKWLPTDEYRTK